MQLNRNTTEVFKWKLDRFMAAEGNWQLAYHIDVKAAIFPAPLTTSLPASGLASARV